MRVELHDVGLMFEGREQLFSNLFLRVESGEFVVVQGESGCGKSTLLRLMNRLQDPCEGGVVVDGEPAESIPVTLLRRRIGYLQQTAVMVAGSIRDNLLVPFRYASATGEAIPDDALLQSELEMFRLADLALDQDASVLSVGQQQRLALIRALLAKPEVLLCDEPTAALDPASQMVVHDRLVSFHKSGRSVVLVTHGAFDFPGLKMRRLRLSGGVLV